MKIDFSYLTENAFCDLFITQHILSLQEKRGGETALHAAVRSKRPGVVGAILDNAFDDRSSFMLEVNSPSSDDNTPLHTATG